MKKAILFTVPMIVGIILLTGFTVNRTFNGKTHTQSDGVVVNIPDQVQTIIDNSCAACHSENGDSKMAMMHVTFDSFKSGEYSTDKAVEKLNNIVKVFEK